MRLRFPPASALLLTAFVALAACESSEERAERHFQTGMALLEEGDVSRALVEFRNVFKLNPQHKEARLAAARAHLANGNRGRAYTQFTRVAEQYPDNIEARTELAEMAITGSDWDEAKRHVEAAYELAPDDPRVKVVNTALQYAQAITDENFDKADKIAMDAFQALEKNPDNFIARRIVVDFLIRNERYEEVIPVLDVGLEQQPQNYDLHSTKVSVQANSGQMEALGDTLRTMVETFPEDEPARQLLMGWYVNQGDNDGAEAFLRELANRPDADDEAHMAVIQFLRLTGGAEAARAEVDRLVETLENPMRFVAVQASMDFDDGKQDEAMAQLEKLVDGVEEPDEVTNNVKLLLARMQTATGNPVGARARIEEIIESDSSHVGALKMRAAWYIDEDQTGDAIIDLRTALAQAPRDAEIMTLMAAAHERAGDRELAGERYSLAVELSEQAPAESLRYANYLTGLERTEAAEAVLDEALLKNPNNLELLQAMVAIQLQNKDWNEVQRIIWKLRSIETEESENIANAVQAEMMLQQDRVDETVEYLRQLSEGEDGLPAFAALVETQVQAGNIDEAVTLVEARLAESPEDGNLRNLRAGLHLVKDERAEAEAIYVSLLNDFPGNDRVLRTLYSIYMASDREDEARKLVDEQVAIADQVPGATDVYFLKAEILERDRDFDGAIAIYEDLYERNSNNIVIANNLASLIATHMDSEESLNRAYAVARRLRGIEIPALQDTYGWIEYRRGNYEEAVKHLEPAAEGLPNDPLVQYHLGRTYVALDRKEDAKRQLQKAIDIAGENPLPQLVKAREILEELGAPATSE
ncbi:MULTISPECIES: tetratricopeptide repeat protein [unclassified Roseovarius]|uniref:tetratricopeptide repeat protein n=1 Tax=unclassified Roseovarius TaxID=2614913 RepID=UPI00273EB62C|nr:MULTISPECIES: tetratricopeptide repeat protein [unclassified Roseovarius]